MPKPSSKITLMEASQQNFKKLMDFVTTLDRKQKQQSFPEGSLNRNIRDVLGHIHFWHLMMIRWYTEGMQGHKPDMPAKGYTWKMTPQLNRKIWEDCQSITLDSISEQLRTSYEQVQEVIQLHSDEELFEKKRYPWTGSTSLGAYLISNTSSHYHWGLQLIKKQFKSI